MHGQCLLRPEPDPGFRMQHLYFVRHGRTEWNAIARMQGQWNSNLDELGRAQADVSGRLLATLNIDAVFASPLDRTRQTADIIKRHIDRPVTYDPRIMEWDCGDWSGHLYSEVEAQWPDAWRAWRADPFYYRGPNCENYPDMIARATPFLHELMQLPAQSIAIISHGMIGKAMLSVLLGLDEATTLSFHQPNDRIFCATLAPSGNTATHFDGQAGPFAGLDSPHDIKPAWLAKPQPV